MSSEADAARYKARSPTSWSLPDRPRGTICAALCWTTGASLPSSDRIGENSGCNGIHLDIIGGPLQSLGTRETNQGSFRESIDNHLSTVLPCRVGRNIDHLAGAPLQHVWSHGTGAENGLRQIDVQHQLQLCA